MVGSWIFFNPSIYIQILPSDLLTFSYRIGPLQLAIHMVQNDRAGEQKSHWDKTNKENYHLKLCMSVVGLVSAATFALQRCGFVPREWLAAKGLLIQRIYIDKRSKYFPLADHFINSYNLFP